ncbi:MAG: hypothetical protein QOH97_1302 [Actinoplanes sp.]|jgi:hypothetical protein|nr:hypothetical protein [Actinoplanes sp.]
MTQSSEYPDLKWMPPASWTNANRTSVQLVVIHTTEGSEGPNSAEDGASYDQRRTDGTSTHFFCDADSTVQCVRTADVAHAARTQGNRRGIQYELCGRAGQGAAGWADPVSEGTLRQAAKQVARDAAKWGIPVRHLSVAQVASGDKGICGHADVTKAFPQDRGTHTDPGPNFPWSHFLELVRAELEDLPMDQATFNKLMTGWAKSADGQAVLLTLTDKIGDTANPNRTVGDVLRDVAKLRGVLVGDKTDTANAKLSPTSPLAEIIAAAVPHPPAA